MVSDQIFRLEDVKLVLFRSGIKSSNSKIESVALHGLELLLLFVHTNSNTMLEPSGACLQPIAFAASWHVGYGTGQMSKDR